MSASSSHKASLLERLANGRRARLVLVSAWVLVGFISSQIIVISLWQSLVQLGLINASSGKEPAVQLSLLALAYILAFFMVVSIPRIIGADKSNIKELPKILGVNKRPSLFDIAIVVPVYFVYLFFSVAFAIALKALFPDINLDQAQEIGFYAVSDNASLILAFIGLVIVPPIAEEFLFRGYLYTYLRKKTNFIATSIIVSLLFALAHLQLNVALDVFALSLVLCGLREYTGKLWACILLHITKNAIAFVILFLKPDILQLLLKS